jgi:hypothetical protein
MMVSVYGTFLLPMSLSLGFGVEVKRFTGFTESDPELGDWTWAPLWFPSLCVLCQ